MNSFFNRTKALTVLALSAGVAFAAPTIEIGTWGNFCTGAVSHTFDDNTPGQLSKAQPEFDAKGFHMTLFTVTTAAAGNGPNWDGLKAAFAKGHEIGSHSDNHGNPMPASECASSQSTIKSKIPGEKCITIAYPNCKNPGKSTVLNSYVAGRNCSGSDNSKSPGDFSEINAKGFGAGQGNYPNTASDLNKFASDAATGGKWGVYMHHGVGSGEHSWASTDVQAIKDHISYLDKNRNTIWCETFGNVARYIRERDAAKVTVTSSDDKSIKCTLTDNLPDATYDYPLSLRCELPSGWTNPTVTQNGKTMKDTIVTANSKSYLMFQAIPDGGEIVLSATTTAIKEQRKILETGKMVLIDNNSLSINSHQFSSSNIAVSIVDLRGKVIANYTLNNSESSVALPSKKLRNEAFFIKVSDGRKTYTEKVTPQL